MAVDTLHNSAAVAHFDIGHGDDTLAHLSTLFATHGDAFRAHSPELGRDLIVLSHPDHVRHVLVDRAGNYAKGIGIERVAILLGKGLMTSEAALWRAQRKAVQPAFHRSAVARHLPAIIAANDALLARWRIAARQGDSVDVSQATSELTLAIVLRAIFGDDHSHVAVDGNPFALLTVESDRDLNFAYAFRKLGIVLQTAIDRRRAQANAGDDILQVLIDARDRHTGEPMPDRQIRDEILTLIVAGHETTASALQWFWYLVTCHPDIAAALQAEARSNDSLASPDAFPLARAAIAETLRLYPPGWLLTRRALGADTIVDTAVQPGDDILVSPYLVQRHPDYWPNPDRFEPTRFMAANAATRSRFAYLPFGLGPRACIGEPLALVEMLVHAVMTLREFTWRADDTAPIGAIAKVNLRPARPIVLRPVTSATA